MDNEKIILLLEDVLQVNPGTITIDTNLKNLEEWDSLAAVLFMTFAEEQFQKMIDPIQLKNCVKVSDLISLLVN